MYFSENSGVVDYLIQKLEEKIKILPKSKIALNNIISLSDLQNNKRDMMQFFSELEDDLTQGTQAIKTMYAQNKDLVEQVENADLRKNRLELKNSTTEKANSELNFKINDLLNENLELKESISNLKIEYTEKINYLESHLDHKKSQIEKLDMINYELEKKIDAMNDEIDELRNLPNNQASPKFKGSGRNEDNTIKSLKSSTRSKGSAKEDYNSKRFSDRDYAKKLLNNELHEHFHKYKEFSERRDNEGKIYI